MRPNPKVEAYCAARGITNGKWWHHDSEEDHESPAAFGRRTVEFRAWLASVRARPGRLSARSVSHSKISLYGAFVWVHRARNIPKRRVLARVALREAGSAQMVSSARGRLETT